MVEREDVVTIEISPAELALCRKFATAAMKGGHSHVYSDREERLQHLSKNQLVGQVGQLAGSKWLAGRCLGHYVYRVGQRDFSHRRNDGGEDILGLNLDFKSCEWRLEGPRGLQDVFLPVRPGERKAGWVYLLVLVEPTFDAAHLVGWVGDAELSEEPNGEGEFEGAHCILTPLLWPIPPFRWQL